MAKRSQRRLARSEKDQLGCMWGFIRLFHFRQGRLTRKLLSDRRRWTSRYATGEQFSGNGLSSPPDLDDQYQSGNDGDESKTKKVDNGRRSVKKLIAEEMSGVQQQGPSAAVEKIETDSKHKGKLGKKCKQSKKNPKVARDLNESLASTSLESQESYCQDLMEQSARNLDLAAVMEEFCSHIRHFQETNQHDGNLKDSGNVQKFISSVKASQLNEFDMDLIRKHSVLQEKLSEATEAFLNQKYIDAKQLARDGKIHQSEQFMDALDILNSNKELFLKLLQDRNSASLKHMQVKGDGQREEVRCEAVEGGKQFQKQSMHKFFRRKAKPEGGNPNPSKGDDSPQASSRIVVLKPSPVNMQTSVATASPQSSLQSQSSLKNQGQSRRVNSNFSFTEIKRKLKHAMRENKNEQHLISMDNSLHKIPSETQRSENRDKGTHGDTLRRDFPSKTYCHIERIARSSSYDRRREKVVKPTDFRADDSNEVASTSGGTHENLATTRAVLRQREYNIYEEAKKHLAEILITEDEEEFSSREFPRTLGRILSLPEYNYSPIFSPGKNREYSSTTEKMRFPPCDDSRIVSENVWRVKQDNNAICPSPLKQKPETPLVAVGDSPESRQQNIGSNEEYQEPFSDVKTGDEVIVEITDIFSEEDKNFFEPIVSAPITRSIQADKTANHKIEGSFELSRMDPHEGNQAQAPSPSVDSFSLSSSLIQKVKDLDDGPERPSPVSVLEPYFLEEDVSSPASSISRPAEPQIQPLQIHFEENDSSSIVITPSDLDISLRICSDDKKPTFEFDENDSSSIVITPSDPDISLRICSDDKKPTFEFDENDSSSIVITPSDPDISIRICSDDKKPTFEYIRAVLQASGLCWDEFFVKYHSSDHLLDPSLFDEVEVLPDQLNSDPKLLFDCINEVLKEIYERYFGCSMWVSFVKPNSRPAPEGNCIVREVWEGIDWHLNPYIPPHSLDQIVAKDLVKGGTWMDLRFNTEAIGIEMGEIMIAELMEDTILELCSC